MLTTHEELRRKIDAMEKRYDARFQAIFDTIRQMLETPIPGKNRSDFTQDRNCRASPPSLLEQV